MSLFRERLLMALLLAALPVGLYGLLLRPSLRRLEALHRRIQRAQDGPAVQAFTPVSREERAFLEDPAAPWRSRLPQVAGDGARLAQVNRVVNEVDMALRARGVAVTAMRAALDPISADFTLPDRLAQSPAPAPAATDAPEYQVEGWVLEVEVAGTTGALFQALSAVSAVNPLLEPVGLRWEASAPAEGATRAGPRQYLLLRNLYLKP
jgi:hypothetical protein